MKRVNVKQEWAKRMEAIRSKGSKHERAWAAAWESHVSNHSELRMAFSFQHDQRKLVNDQWAFYEDGRTRLTPPRRDRAKHWENYGVQTCTQSSLKDVLRKHNAHTPEGERVSMTAVVEGLSGYPAFIDWDLNRLYVMPHAGVEWPRGAKYPRNTKDFKVYIHSPNKAKAFYAWHRALINRYTALNRLGVLPSVEEPLPVISTTIMGQWFDAYRDQIPVEELLANYNDIIDPKDGWDALWVYAKVYTLTLKDVGYFITQDYVDQRKLETTTQSEVPYLTLECK